MQELTTSWQASIWSSQVFGRESVVLNGQSVWAQCEFVFEFGAVMGSLCVKYWNCDNRAFDWLDVTYVRDRRLVLLTLKSCMRFRVIHLQQERALSGAGDECGQLLSSFLIIMGLKQRAGACLYMWLLKKRRALKNTQTHMPRETNRYLASKVNFIYRAERTRQHSKQNKPHTKPWSSVLWSKKNKVQSRFTRLVLIRGVFWMSMALQNCEHSKCWNTGYWKSP